MKTTVGDRSRGLSFLLVLVLVTAAQASERRKVFITSSIDQDKQPCYIILPDDFANDGDPVPLLVSLHSWSATCEQRNTSLEAEANRLGWIYLFPNFRGANDDPNACGSVKAQQDVLDAVAWCRANYPVDSQRIYLSGNSGGGHMTMLMVGRHPKLWAAASAWVGISDLAHWHRLHEQRKSKYARMMVQVCGGKPGESAAVDEEYRQRSPLTYLHQSIGVPLDIGAGVHDGHTGSVPIHHSLNAFNAIAKAAGDHPVGEEEIAQLSARDGRLARPKKSDVVVDKAWGRKIYLRRRAGKSRVTIFEGGHEGIASAAVDWFEKHVKPE